jgi:rhodanese-related sulfurtransferase
MDQQTLIKLIESEQNPVIVDVRSGWEYRRDRIPGAIHLPFWRSWVANDGVNKAVTKPVIVYCEHGPRAVLAGLFLRVRGVTDIHLLKGHMLEWRRAELPMECGDVKERS